MILTKKYIYISLYFYIFSNFLEVIEFSVHTSLSVFLFLNLFFFSVFNKTSQIIKLNYKKLKN